MPNSLFSEPGHFCYMVNGNCLQGKIKSAVTDNWIRGPAYQLEDGKTYMSQEHALEWALCNNFTPVGNGFRINPY